MTKKKIITISKKKKTKVSKKKSNKNSNKNNNKNIINIHIKNDGGGSSKKNESSSIQPYYAPPQEIRKSSMREYESDYFQNPEVTSTNLNRNSQVVGNDQSSTLSISNDNDNSIYEPIKLDYSPISKPIKQEESKTPQLEDFYIEPDSEFKSDDPKAASIHNFENNVDQAASIESFEDQEINKVLTQETALKSALNGNKKYIRRIIEDDITEDKLYYDINDVVSSDELKIFNLYRTDILKIKPVKKATYLDITHLVQRTKLTESQKKTNEIKNIISTTKEKKKENKTEEKFNKLHKIYKSEGGIDPKDNFSDHNKNYDDKSITEINDKIKLLNKIKIVLTKNKKVPLINFLTECGKKNINTNEKVEVLKQQIEDLEI